MFNETITTKFSDTDALGHISNTMIPVWFEGARDPIFKMFMPSLNLDDWQLILAKINIDFHRQLYYGKPVDIRTYISRIGGASFDIYQEVWQTDKKCASGIAVMVNFCFKSQQSKVISDDIREQMKAHLFIEPK